MIDLVADHVAALDREYLDCVLGGGHGHLASVVTERIGTGQVAVTVRATLRWTVDDPSLPTTVVVKVAATEPDTPERQRRSATYRREVCFYRLLASRIATSVPACRHAAHDPATGGFTIVLDEVSGAVGDQLRGCTVAEADAVVDAAVGLHAPTWADPTLTSFDWLHASDDESRRARRERYRLLLPGFTEIGRAHV